MEHTDHCSHHSCTHHHSQHGTLAGECLYSSVTVSGIVWNILITPLTTAALTTILNTGLYQVSFYTHKRKNQVDWLEMVRYKDLVGSFYIFFAPHSKLRLSIINKR